MARRCNDLDRAVIVARRARFVATALASIGVGVSPALAFALTDTEDPPPRAGLALSASLLWH